MLWRPFNGLQNWHHAQNKPWKNMPKIATKQKKFFFFFFRGNWPPWGIFCTSNHSNRLQNALNYHLKS
jgi:hypothetical protein